MSRTVFAVVVLGVAAVILGFAPLQDAKKDDANTRKVPAVLNFTMNSLDGQPVQLKKYAGNVVMIVNTASKCGYTPQYKELEALHEKYTDKGLVILGFPCNEFKEQEPGSDSDIKKFCAENYGVKFDMFSKVKVLAGEDQCALYKYLTDEKTDPKFPGEVQWNFEKFLISRDGEIVNRFRSKVKPDSEEVIKAIEAELEKKATH